MELADLQKEIKGAVEPVMKAFEAFKETNDARVAQLEKKGAADPVIVEKLSKIEKDLDKHEDLNQKITQIQQQSKAAQEAVDRMEVAIARVSGAKGGGHRDPIALKALVNDWARAVVKANTVGVVNLSDGERKALADVSAEMKALNVSTDTAGGYLAPVEYVRDILKGVTDISPIRSIARVRSTANKSIQIPKRTAQFAAQWVSEQGTRSETTGLAYGLEELPAHEMYALIDISNQMLDDAAFDMEAEISMEATEQFAKAEGTAFVSGNAVGKPEGYMTNSSVSENSSGSAAVIADANGQANGLITLKYALNSKYAANAVWAMNRTTMGSVRKLKDGQNNYIWMPGIQNGAPATIDGDPYVEVPDMPSEGANLYPIAYGDFRRAYMIVDRIAMEMLRDPYTQATSGNIRFIMRKRVGGQVVMAEAIRKLKCST